MRQFANNEGIPAGWCNLAHATWRGAWRKPRLPEMPRRCANTVRIAGHRAACLAGLLAWDLSREFAPTASAILIAWMLANSEVIVVLSNPSAFAISLAVIGSWCLLKKRFLWIGMVLFALSLCLKPQDAAPVWCFFLLTGSEFRKRALHTALITAALSVPALLWVWHQSPHWTAELHSNLGFLSAPGGPADPGPLDPDSEFVDMQVVFSRIKDVPAFYNTLSYIVGIPLLFVWALLAVGSARKRSTHALSLAAVIPLSLLPVYHHFYDTKLLLLCIPGFAQLWSAGRKMRWLALAFTLAALIVTADLPHTVLNRNHLGRLAAPFLPSLPVLLAPITLMAMGIFYLWALRRFSQQSPPDCDDEVVPSHGA